MAVEEERGKIEVFGARVHNLKNIDVEIPHNSLTVITGSYALYLAFSMRKSAKDST